MPDGGIDMKTLAIMILLILGLLVLPIIVTRLGGSPTKASNDVVTLDEYNRVQVGMSYEMVRDIVGAEGRLVYEDINNGGVPKYGFPGVHRQYAWRNSNGVSIPETEDTPGFTIHTGMSATFEDNKLTDKSQLGLK